MNGRTATEKAVDSRTLNRLKDVDPYFTDYYDFLYSSSARTRQQYVYEAIKFYEYAMDECDASQSDTIPVSIQQAVKPVNLVRYFGKNEASANTFNKRKLAISSFYNFMVTNNDVPFNPVEKIKFQKVNADPKEPLTRDQVNLIRNYVYFPEEMTYLTPRMKVRYVEFKKMFILIFELMLYHGIRAAGIMEMTTRDIDFSRNVIKISQKGGNTFKVKFGPKMKVIIEDWLKERKQLMQKHNADHDFVIISPVNCKPMEPKALDGLLDPFCYKLDRNVTPHDFRRTFGRNLYESSGHNIVAVQKALGHKNVETTMRYICVDMDEVDDLILEMEDKGLSRYEYTKGRKL